jgi:nitrate/nitrite transporter NarK
MSAANTVFSSVMPDYLHNVLKVGGDVRGALEFPRELPGFLQVVLAGLVAGFAKRRSLLLCFAAGVAAFAGLALIPPSSVSFIALMILWSAGMHLYVPIRDAVAMELAPGSRRGWILGTVGAWRSVGLMLGTGAVWLAMRGFGGGFAPAYAGAAVMLAVGALLSLAVPGVASDRASGSSAPTLGERFVMRREYTLFYILATLFGARKQIFLTFAPWLLVSVYGQQAPDLALAMGVAAVLGLFSKPLFGDLIDRYGERRVLTVESVLVFLMCVTYAAAPTLLGRASALAVLYAVYVADELLFSLAMARSTYLARIASCSGDVAPTLALGGTLDHAVSMVIPAGAGLLWMTAGPWSVFALAALVAVANLLFVRRMKG